MSDYGVKVCLPNLVTTIRRDAPGIDLEITSASRERMLLDLIDGETDLALGVFPNSPEELSLKTLFIDTFVSAADTLTLPVKGNLSLEEWIARPHILVMMKAGMDNEIDRALAAINIQRRVCIDLPYWYMANELLPDTDLLLTVASRTLPDDFPDHRLSVFDPPFPIEPFPFRMAWHNRRDNDPAGCV